MSVRAQSRTLIKLEMNNRYNRQTILPQVGESGQEKLSMAKVLVVGAGGLGCAVLPYLTSAGIGTFGIIDFDLVDETNLHRQVIYKEASIGKSKVEEAKKQLVALNSIINIKTYNEKLNPNNIIKLFKQYDIIVDATDTISIRYLINDACVITNKPCVYGSVFKFEGQVSVFNYQNGPTYRCLYPNNEVTVQSCTEVGVLGVVVGMIGMLQANEVIKMILQIGEVLSGQLLMYNSLTNDQNKFIFQKKESLLIDENFFKNEYLEMPLSEIPANKALEKKCLFLDVREYDETPKLDLENSMQIPLSILKNELNQLNIEDEILLYCQSGIRSIQAIKILKEHHFKNVRSIQGGAIALQKLIKETV